MSQNTNETQGQAVLPLDSSNWKLECFTRPLGDTGDFSHCDRIYDTKRKVTIAEAWDVEGSCEVFKHLFALASTPSQQSVHEWEKECDCGNCFPDNENRRCANCNGLLERLASTPSPTPDAAAHKPDCPEFGGNHLDHCECERPATVESLVAQITPENVHGVARGTPEQINAQKRKLAADWKDVAQKGE